MDTFLFKSSNVAKDMTKCNLVFVSSHYILIVLVNDYRIFGIGEYDLFERDISCIPRSTLQKKGNMESIPQLIIHAFCQLCYMISKGLIALLVSEILQLCNFGLSISVVSIGSSKYINCYSKFLAQGAHVADETDLTLNHVTLEWIT